MYTIYYDVLRVEQFKSEVHMVGLRLRRFICRKLFSAAVCAGSIFLWGALTPVSAEDPDGIDADIAGANLEQLLGLTITTVSRMPETLRQTAAAASVLTGEEIRRSGARSVPEALRLIPGVNVARLDANKWAVSIRGFNDRTANKLLVMIDGRTIYDPFFSGTLWETKDPFIEDIDRIEIVRGPGGSAWGANAVNGVINIITKNARDTQGGLVVAGGGSEERGFTDARYGLKIADDSFIRAYGSYYNRNEGYLTDGVSDDSFQGLGGFRFDQSGEDNTKLSLQGSYSNGEHDGVINSTNITNRESVLQADWQKKLSKDSELSINGYFNHTDYLTTTLGEKRDTGEINVQHNFVALEDLDISSGVQLRVTTDDISYAPESPITLDPRSRDDTLISAFIQAKYVLLPNELEARIGSKLEHNDFSGFELQPDIGLTWTPTKQQTIWGSISRAVRTPSRLENDFKVLSGPLVNIIANRDLESERLTSYQIGYRRDIFSDLSIDLATFYNHYDRLIVLSSDTLDNAARSNGYGGELSTIWSPEQWWSSRLGFSLLRQNVSVSPGSIGTPSRSVDNIEGNAPEHQLFLVNSLTEGKHWQSDVTLRYVDELSSPRVPSYFVGDARVSYKVSDVLELAIIGQNLLSNSHFEQGGASASKVQPGVYGQVTWKF